ncbi:MAG: hypothetical protein HW421_2480 [Ignavibacteria bacterium]|nr:hypothetical protein [Ignavibacteria bacterium]
MILLKTPAFIKSAKSILKNDLELVVDFEKILHKVTKGFAFKII